MKVNGQEVTPFLNSLYKSKETYAFDNFFHQVGQGKTSDAENLLETSTFGLSQGSLFATLGSDNTFEAAPAILNQRAGYTSAVFHGNVASFWNRNNVYKNMGYQYFFDASYYDTSGDKSTGYGLKDKLLFKDSIKYLENLQQPFYVKYITVTNHFPFDLDSEDTDPNFTAPDTGSTTVDNYFVTSIRRSRNSSPTSISRDWLRNQLSSCTGTTTGFPTAKTPPWPPCSVRMPTTGPTLTTPSSNGYR